MQRTITSGEGGVLQAWGSGWYPLLGKQDMLQGCIVQHWEYSQSFVIIINDCNL